MSDKTELLPCPFCGSAAEFETIPAGALAKCPGCGVAMMNGGIGVGWYGSRELAAADWNRRADLAQQPAPEAPETFNEWFLALPEGRQVVLREDRWMLADAAYAAGKLAATPAAPVAQDPAEDAGLAFSALPFADFWRWLHRCNRVPPAAEQPIGDSASPVAEQPVSVAVPRELLEQAGEWLLVVTHSEQVPNHLSQQAAAAHFYVRALLAGGAA